MKYRYTNLFGTNLFQDEKGEWLDLPDGTPVADKVLRRSPVYPNSHVTRENTKPVNAEYSLESICYNYWLEDDNGKYAVPKEIEL